MDFNDWTCPDGDLNLGDKVILLDNSGGDQRPARMTPYTVAEVKVRNEPCPQCGGIETIILKEFGPDPKLGAICRNSLMVRKDRG